MAYSDYEKLKGLLPEKTLIKLSNDQSSGATEADMIKISQVIAQADELIDGYVGLQRSVPLDPVPLLIRSLSAQFAVYFLHLRRGPVPDEWDSQYKRNEAVLVKLGEGKLTLGSVEGEKPTEAPDQVLAYSSGKKMGGAGGLLENF